MNDVPLLDISDVHAAAQRLEGVVHRTPVFTSTTLDDRVGAQLFLKAECYQRTGSFKFRGAFNTIAAMSEADRAKGIVAFSSGNHAQGVALAAKLHGVPAAIVMPEDAPVQKMKATAGYGAEIITYDRYTQGREELGEALTADRDMTLVPPFDHLDVMAGQGTAALELFDEVGDLDSLVVCVGGGGLISGCSTVAKARGDVRVVGVEPEAGNDVYLSLEAGEIVSIDTPRTIADGQQTIAPSQLTLATMMERVDEIALVSDTEIIDTMRFVFERMNIVLEPSGASALAAIVAGHIDVRGQRVGVTLSGGNIGVDRFTELLG